MGSLGLNTPVLAALTVDSYFGVVTNFGAMQPQQGYKTQTVVSLVAGLSAMVGIVALSLVLR